MQGEQLVSSKCKGDASPYVIGPWAGLGSRLLQDTSWLGKILCFVRHSVALDAAEVGVQASKHFNTSHIFAKVQWYCRHPKESWLPSPVLILSVQNVNPLVMLHLFSSFSRIKCTFRCAAVLDNIKFDFGKYSLLLFY